MKSCSVGSCDRAVLARGLCGTHYDRWRRNGDPGPAEIRQLSRRPSECQVEGCGRPVSGRGYCGAHYWRLRTHGDPGPAEIQRRVDWTCTVVGCERPTVGQGLCRMHYERRRKGREVGSPEPQRPAPGEGSLNNGYKVITVAPGRSRLEHRVIMEGLLGRPLAPGETVHHVNGQRCDNTTDGRLDADYRSGNLELWSTWQPAGQRVADKVSFAAALLRRYAPHLLVQVDSDGSEAAGSSSSETSP